MAFDVTALTAYIEDQDFPLIASMQATGGLAEHCSIQTGIKDSSNLQFLTTDVVFGADGCSRTPANTTTFSQRTLTVGAIAISEDLCVKTLNGFWTQTKVKQGSKGEEETPAEIESVYMDKKGNALSAQLAVSDFQGDTLSGTNNLSYYDGFIKIVDAATGVVNGNVDSVASVTAANVLDVMNGMWESMPDDISEMTDNSFWIPTRVYKLYVTALKNANLYHYPVQGEQEMFFGTDLPLRKTVGLPGTAAAERMFITYDSNITIGMDGESDEDSIEVRLNPATNKSVFYDVTFKRGVQIAFPTHIVEFTAV